MTEVKSGPACQKTEGFELRVVMRQDEAKLKDYSRWHRVEKYTADADALHTSWIMDQIIG